MHATYMYVQATMSIYSHWSCPLTRFLYSWGGLKKVLF